MFFFFTGDLRNENTGCRKDVTSVLFSIDQRYVDTGKMDLKIVLTFLKIVYIVREENPNSICTKFFFSKFFNHLMIEIQTP